MISLGGKPTHCWRKNPKTHFLSALFCEVGAPRRVDKMISLGGKPTKANV